MAITLNGSTGITDVNGTAAAPAITGTDTDSGVYFGTNSVGLATNGANAFTADATTNIFYTGGTERMRIDSSGNLLVGDTSNIFDSTVRIYGKSSGFAGFFYTTAASGYSATAFSRNGNDGNVCQFYRVYNGSTVGSISVTSSATAYNTSSDYRLKNSVAPMTGALAKVAQLKPVTYKWNVDGTDGEGFIAHELAEVVPHAVTGEKDAVDEEGKPQYQGIDTSFLVATLTAAIQEQQALITQLTDRIAALEAK